MSRTQRRDPDDSYDEYSLSDPPPGIGVSAERAAEIAQYGKTEQEIGAFERLAARPEQLGDARQGVPAGQAGLLLAAFARAWRAAGAPDLAQLLDPSDPQGRLESVALEEMAECGDTPAGDHSSMMEQLRALGGVWLADALDPGRVGGNRCAAPAPRDAIDRPRLRDRFAECFALEIENERALRSYSDDERCPLCGAAAAPDPERGPAALRCFTCGPLNPMAFAAEGGAA